MVMFAAFCQVYCRRDFTGMCKTHLPQSSAFYGLYTDPFTEMGLKFVFCAFFFVYFYKNKVKLISEGGRCCFFN